MAIPERSHNGDYTYKDYAQWPEEERWELIDGIAYAQATPTRDHQRISRELLFYLTAFFRGQDCEPFHAPFSVVLPEKNQQRQDARTVVEPDLVVICDQSRLHKHGYEGSPELIIEILSPSTSSKDMITKRLLYERHKVKEYWIIDPVHRIVTVYRLEGAKFTTFEHFSHKDTLTTPLFPGLAINLSQVFANIGEEADENRREILTVREE